MQPQREDNALVRNIANKDYEYGFTTNDIKTTYVAYDYGISQLEDGNVDAVYIQTAIPASAIQQLAAGGKGYRLLSVDEAIANELCEEYGYFGYGTIASTVYDNMKEDVNTMYVSNMVAVRADLDEDLVYEMTKAIFENLDIIKSSHKAASGLSLENAVRVSIPMHPGAERYFKEVGAMYSCDRSTLSHGEHRKHSCSGYDAGR